MAQKPVTDARQADFFGAPTPTRTPTIPDFRPSNHDKRGQKTKGPAPPPGRDVRREQDSLDTLAARLSPAELAELAAALSDQALAHLVLAAVRQLRRRLARTGRQAGQSKTPSSLERAARQLVAELGEYGADDDL